MRVEERAQPAPLTFPFLAQKKKRIDEKKEALYLTAFKERGRRGDLTTGWRGGSVYYKNPASSSWDQKL